MKFRSASVDHPYECMKCEKVIPAGTAWFHGRENEPLDGCVAMYCPECADKMLHPPPKPPTPAEERILNKLDEILKALNKQGAQNGNSS